MLIFSIYKYKSQDTAVKNAFTQNGGEMGKKGKSYFTTGEFAKLCHTTKNTLFHYDQIGLLKPEIIKDNGYRYYSKDQFWAFDIISVLKQAGTPLKEIIAYLDNQDTESFINIMEEKKENLKLEQKKLQKMIQRIQNTIDLASYALSAEWNEARVEYCEEEYLITTPFKKPGEEDEQFSIVYEHYDYVTNHYPDADIPLGTILKKENIEKGNYEYIDFYYSKIGHKIKSKRMVIRPEGYYIIFDHKGSYDDMPRSYIKIKEYLKENNLSIHGDGYEQDMINHLAVPNPDDFIVQIAIPIVKNE